MIQTALTSPRKTFLKPIPATRNLTVRKSVYDLSDAEVLALRKAFAALQALSDNRGYQYVASVHGLNQYLCPHSEPRFLIWHRPYVLMFEQALQSVSPANPQLGLPYWDWTSERAQQEGIPAIFAARTYKAGKKTVSNPLYAAPISFMNNDNLTRTSRSPGPLTALGVLPGLVRSANRATRYDRFSASVEQPHNQVHGWVGGTMGSIAYAAFDPIFWVHHCFIEKLFCEWQDRTSAPISPAIAGQVLAPFNKRTEEVWNYKTLGYRFGPEPSRLGASTRALMLAKSRPVTTLAATFDLAKVPEDLEQADLNFVKTRHPKHSFEARVFFNEPEPTAKTTTDKNPRYAGSLFTFGHGGCTGDAGHCAVPEVPEDASHFATVRPPHHLTPKRLTLDVTKALRLIKSSSPRGILEVHLVFVDASGNELPQDSMDFELLTLDAV